MRVLTRDKYQRRLVADRVVGHAARILPPTIALMPNLQERRVQEHKRHSRKKVFAANCHAPNEPTPVDRDRQLQRMVPALSHVESQSLEGPVPENLATRSQNLHLRAGPLQSKPSL